MIHKKILVVDDQEEVLFFIKEGIKAFLGCESDQASNGAQALDLLRANSYDLVITDENMPGISGTELVKKMKNEMNLAVPVLLLSGEILQEQITLEKELEEVHVRLKPVRMESFFKEVAAMLGAAQGAAMNSL